MSGWHVDEARGGLDGHLQFGIFDAEGVRVGGATAQRPVRSNDPASHTPAGQPEAWANAKLQAAAPELADALEALTSALKTGDDPRPAYVAAQEALRKAGRLA